MASIQKRYFYFLTGAFFSLILLALGCASVQPPTGGPKDKTPPKVIRETPKNLSLNFATKEIDIEFDEFIKLAQEFKEISISPSLNKLPTFKYKKNILSIRFPDSLEKNTTYTINFGKSIIDYNEGNILKNYSYVFSTGNVIDSLSISGNVVQSLNKKPEIEIPVFIIPTRQDSLFRKKPANIFTTTDSLGNFTFNNLKPDTYRIYALKEPGGGDRVYNSINEEIAFLADSIVLTKNITGVNLHTFKEIPPVFSTVDRKISGDGRMFFTFNQAMNKPSLKILNSKELDNQKAVEFNIKGDTASLWIPEMSFDSLNVAVQNNLIALDTVVLKRAKRDTYTKTLTVRDNLTFTELSQQTGLLLTLSAPATSFDIEKITILDDTTRIKNFKVIKDTTSVRRYKIDYPWRPGHGYTIRLADNTFTGPFGSNKYYTSSFKLSANDNFGNLTLAVTVPSSGDYLIELLNDKENVIKINKISGSAKIPYRNLPAGKYSIRVIYDINKNGKWDTGNVLQKKQPEPVWNSDKIISLRSNWDMDESLAIPAP
jgi:hypothetical protein